MSSTFLDILETLTFFISIYFIVIGYSKNPKYSDNNYIRKRIRVIGIILLLLVLLVEIPGAIQAFSDGYNATRR
jgi:Kef-type K+ transport system membrane component KefB